MLSDLWSQRDQTHHAGFIGVSNFDASVLSPDAEELGFVMDL